jgi:hypothetical protein
VERTVGHTTPRIAEQLDDLLFDPPAPVGREELDAARSRLEAAAERAASLVDGHDAAHRFPLRLPKGRVDAVLTCERHAVARHAAPFDDALPLPLLQGVALDRYVLLELVTGPVADPLEDLLSMLDAQADHATRDQVIAAADELGPHLAALATAAREWSGLDPSWWPRTQSPAAIHLAGGRVVSEGRVDVELGGPLTGRPGVVVEVKSGAPRHEHLAEVTQYALLVALRDGVAPALVARWYPGGRLAHLPVTADVLFSAERRLSDAISVWAELQAGRPPTERSGPACGWCPAADVCPTAVAPADPLAFLDEAWDHGSADDA